VPPVTRQYKLVLTNGHLCFAVGKITVDLASHLPSVTDLVVWYIQLWAWCPK